jgi:hypothetical protein
MGKPVLEVGAIQCPSCKDIVFSRASHDMRSCRCAAVSIDGGRDYMKVSFAKVAPATIKLTLIGLTSGNLYDDWNRRFDLLGRVRVLHDVDATKYRYTLNASGKFYRYPIA